MPTSRSKYRAVRTVVDGVTFHSKREATRYGQLRLLERAGEVRELELQPKFPLYVARASNGELVKVADYIADFRYRDRSGAVVIEDVKGYSKEPYYRLKVRMFQGQYDLTIREV